MIVGDQRLGDGLPDGVNLGDATSALDADANVDVGESGFAQEKHWLLKLGTKGDGLDELQRPAIHLDETLAVLAVGDGGGRFLAAENLYRSHGLCHFYCRLKNVERQNALTCRLKLLL